MPPALLLTCLLAVVSFQAVADECGAGSCLIGATDLVLLSVRTKQNRAGRAGYTPGEDGTYSQNYQDAWAKQLAQHNNWTADTAFFLDLGAYDGIQCSNTALLEKQLGWQGICVEPFPKGFESRKCVLASRALTDKDDQKLNFGGSEQDRSLNLLGEGQGLSATSISIGTLLDCVKGTATAGVSCQGVAGHAAVPRLINFASLDVEGSEATVLETFPWHKYKVAAWVVENAIADTRPARAQAKVRSLLQAKGYIRAPVENSGVDEYFVLPEFWHPSLAAKKWRVHPKGSHGC